jgi:hypothetical protein
VSGHGAEKDAARLAEESFRHSWDMSDERLIDGAWVVGLCCECGDFVPYGQEVAHVAAALAPLIEAAKAAAWDDGHDCCTYPICRDNPHRVTPPGEQS